MLPAADKARQPEAEAPPATEEIGSMAIESLVDVCVVCLLCPHYVVWN